MRSVATLFPVLLLAAAQDEPPDPGDDSGKGVAWRENILTSSGGIDGTRYEAVARAYHTRACIDYRFGPRASHFHDREEDFPSVHQPKPDGVIAINAGPWARLNPGPDGDPGAGWLMSGQLLFSPAPNAPPEFRAGCANARSADGARSEKDGGLCMRLRADWKPDWWARNSISTPTCPAIPLLKKAYPDLTLPPIATARGAGGGSVTGFLAFTNGAIGVAGTGNDPYTSEGFTYPHTRLPGGKFPTAMAVTQNNEFVLVTVWNPSEKKGQMAVIAVLGRQNAQERRYYWGLAGGWPTVRGLKVLGFVDLPFAAPMAIDAAVDIALGNTRGHGDNVNDDLSIPAVRERWMNAHKNPSDYWKQTARFGYAIISSRAEDKVAIVNLRPLLDYYRKMHLTTQERFLQTTQSGPGKNQWPFTFEEAPEQKPKVVATWTVRQPTVVSVGAARGSFVPPRSAGRDPLCSLKIAYVGTLSGTLRLYDVTAIFEETPTRPMASGPSSFFRVGRNPTAIFHGYHSTAPDDLFVVSRGDRTITHAEWNGKIRGVLRDRRIKDPVHCFVSLDQAGFGGAGPGKAVHANILSVIDFGGGQVHTYAVENGINANGEQLPILDAEGKKAPFMHGFSSPMPGWPFMMTVEEVI